MVDAGRVSAARVRSVRASALDRPAASVLAFLVLGVNGKGGVMGRRSETYLVLIRDDKDHDGGRVHRGPVYFVGRRQSLEDTVDSVDILRRDPLTAGYPFGVHAHETARGWVVDWSDDWCAVVDASLAGHIMRRDLGPDTFGDVEHILPAELTS